MDMEVDSEEFGTTKVRWFHVSHQLYNPERLYLHCLEEVSAGPSIEGSGIPVDLKVMYHGVGSDHLFPWVIEVRSAKKRFFYSYQ